MSSRLANRSNERSLQKETLRRQLRGRHARLWPAPTDAPEGELHVYTDGSASRTSGRWCAGCGVWFADASPYNISAIPKGRQTVNRAELTAVILAVRKALTLPKDFQRLIVFSDSSLCVDGMNKWVDNWKIAGWTRNGRPLANADLWRVLCRAKAALLQAGLQLILRHVPAHVGIYGNEKADRLAKAAAVRAHTAASRTDEEREEMHLDALADAIVDACTNR